MSEFRYSVRDRDAVWITHRELSYNDGVLRKQRRAGKKRRSTNITAPRRLIIATPGQRSIAAKRLRDAAQRLGASAEDLDMVLAMVGLSDAAELTTTYTDKGERRRRVGPCPDCKRPYIQLKTDGTFISHPTQSRLPLNDDTRCPGSGKLADKAEQPRDKQPEKPPAATKPRTQPAREHSTPALPNRRPACRDEDPEIFYLPSYGKTYAEQVAKAQRVCRQCPLIRECLDYALDHGELEHGIWGGLTPYQRRQLLTRKAAA
ncbi:WhiB family transcriptional regulator [Nonomuraea polychroma]|uniref:WhiB family transcriptional regulator n=1 Tax=Nonomuraea polychroma TaxID=46176 RepID=UPI003D90A9CF